MFNFSSWRTTKIVKFLEEFFSNDYYKILKQKISNFNFKTFLCSYRVVIVLSAKDGFEVPIARALDLRLRFLVG